MSPYYIDLTWLLSSPRDFKCVVDVVVDEIKDLLSFIRVDKLASIELKGALLIPSIANELKLPCVVVRKERKRYGITGRIAGGEVKDGDHILFFDDVVASAKSKLEGIGTLEELGAKVEMILVVVDREQGGKENLEKLGYQFRALTTISELVNTLLQSGKITEEQAEIILGYTKKRVN
jgi:orotate phosphoribosyltransferase